METLTNAEIRNLKGMAQRIKPIFHVGKSGVTPEFVSGLEEALKQKELVKIKFSDFKEEKYELAEQIAQRTASHLITVLGHVAVFYRKKPVADTVAKK
ncbi:MAG TPA: YhbY family RNA-binding protein [Verrucomicrobiae bacterium]|jgi:RNA-binding protein